MRSLVFLLTILSVLWLENSLAQQTRSAASNIALMQLTRDPLSPLDTPLGDVYQAGTTWYDMQHNATAGRTVAIDSAGYAHLVWTNGLDITNANRHVYYNVWMPGISGMQWPSGVQVNPVNRAGFATVATDANGWAFPAFHHVPTGGPALTQAAIDFDPRAGAFTATGPVPVTDTAGTRNTIWPKVALDGDGIVHVVSSYSHSNGMLVYYSRGTPTFDDGHGLEIVWQTMNVMGEGFRFLDSAIAVSADITASRQSQRIAVAYTKLREGAINILQQNSDVMLMLSDDGGVNWNAPVNLTNFTDEDEQHAFGDLSIVFDDNDNLQLAFTVCSFWELPDSTFGTSDYLSRIFQWNEATGEFHTVASAWTEGTHRPGQGFVNVCRPSLSVDPISGDLYCVYRKFTQDNWSASDSALAGSDIFVSRSIDDGAHWSDGTNLTQTTPLVNPCVAGDCMNERDATVAERVTYSGAQGYLHLAWELDFDNGTWLLNEGTRTLNEVYYQRVAIDLIPATPHVTDEPLHNTPAPVDDLVISYDPNSTGYSLHWSTVPGADVYNLYGSSSLDLLFSPLSQFATVADTFFHCPGCLLLAPDLAYFGVIGEHNPPARAVAPMPDLQRRRAVHRLIP
ncbi:MAG: exo-alpha-sialidase [bacterium]|nr:exo-alpha-sialidase [bacterium]